MISTRGWVLITLVVILGTSAVPAAAEDVAAAAERLGGYGFAVQPTRVAQAGFRFEAVGIASFDLADGELRAAETGPDGIVPGFVFEGHGVFRMKVADRFERAQLMRFSGRVQGPVFEAPFTRMVVRSSRRWPELEALAVASDRVAKSKLAEDRLEAWLRDGSADIDARVVAGLASPGDDYLWVEVETEADGWLAFEFDPWRMEPVSLSKLYTHENWVEDWVRLPGPDSPPPPEPDRLDLEQIDVDVDLSEHDAREWTSTGAVEGDLARFRATVRLRPSISGPHAVQLNLARAARVVGVTASDGAPLPFVRSEVGRRFATVDHDLSDRSLVVGLPAPLAADEPVELVVEYTRKIYNFATGGDWYPVVPGALNDLHNVRMAFTLPAKVEVRAVGRRIESRPTPNGSVEVWQTERPVKMAGFAFGARYKEECVTVDGIPEVCVFGRESGVTTGNMVRNVAADVANSLRFFSWLVDTKVPCDRLVASRISGSHGQAFDGFLHLSSFTFDSESPGASELFRSHEVAHQFWGHMVGWRSYRDQWLSEALAEYSAMLFVDASLPKDHFYQEIVDTYVSEQIGGVGAVLSKFLRPWSASVFRSNRRILLGPIAAGYRASSAQVPYGYFIQIYDRGALVIHMLRTMLRERTGSDDTFRAILKDFVDSYAGRAASTRDFQAVVARNAPAGGDWGWFFDQWVYGTWVPTYTWSTRVPSRPNADGRWVAEVTVAQSDVPEGFVMPVPMRVDFGGGKTGEVLLPVRQGEETFQVPLSARPRKLELNPDNAVLARMRHHK